MRRNIIGRRIPNPISSSPFSTSSGRGGGGGRGGANPFSASDKLDSSARAPGKPEYEESKPVSPDPQSGIGRGSGGGVDFASFISALRTSKPGVGRGRGTDEPPRSRPTPPQPREVPNQPFRGQPYQQPQSVPNQGQFADSAEDNLRFRGPPHQQHQSVPDQRQFEQNVQFRGPPHQQHQSGPDQRQFEQQFRGPPHQQHQSGPNQRQFEQQFRGPPHQQHQSGPNQRQFEQQFRGPPHQQPQSGQFEQNMQFRGPPHEQHQSGQGQFEQNMQFRGPPHQQHQSGQRQFEQNMQFRGPPHQQHQSGHRQFEQNMQPRMDLQPSGIGRGTSDVPPPLPQPTPRLTEENRHVRSHGRPQPGGKQQAEARVERPKLSREDAVKRAVSILSKGDGEGAGGRGGGYGRGRGGRGRGGFQGRERFEDGDSYGGLDMGDDADGERLAERLGVENMQKLVEEFQNLCDKVLPTPEQDAYVDALHTNYAIEFEPEYLMGEFDQNPDIDEKPPMPLRDMLEKVKPFIMAYEGIQSQEEWEEVVEETMKRVPALKEIVDYYSGPDRVTAKKQSEELERVAKLIPPNAPASVKQFTDRAVLSLQSNPGWGFDKKCQYMDKLVREVNQCYP